MAQQLQDMVAELVGQVPGLPRIMAQTLVNRAIREVRKDYLWSWNINEGVLITPIMISTGTVAVVQFSPIITFDATAQAILGPLVTDTVPLTKRQFRIPGGPIYNILAYNNTNGQMTLDRLYTETSNPTGQYTIYRCYYEPPSTDGVTPNLDFLRYLSINNNIQGYQISGRRLTRPRTELNRRDPLRGALGQPYFAFAYKPTYNAPGNSQQPTAGLMQYELWPHPTNLQSYLCQYEMAHVDLALTDYLPLQAPPTLIQYRVWEFVYRWALQNSARIPELKGVDWRFLLAESQKTYARELVAAKRNDKEIMLQIIKPGSSTTMDFQGPIDSNFYQSHGLAAL